MSATIGEFPARRLRRLREHPALRELRRETRVHPHDLIQPLFVTDDRALRGPVEGMPGVARIGIEELPEAVAAVEATGVRGVLLFGAPRRKDERGSEAFEADGLAARAIGAAREGSRNIAVITDLCLCQYTTHGQCGLVRGGRIANDGTLETLARAAAEYARAGATLVAPSGMMDGGVSAVRAALDGADAPDVGVLAYSVKLASALYGPFREAGRSTAAVEDRSTHQIDPANGREALAKAEQDAREGADIVMVKPALTALDLVAGVRARLGDLPVAAYEVSGEHAMLEAAAAQGMIDRRRAALESLTAIKRAGADMIVTYRAAEAAGWLREGEWS